MSLRRLINIRILISVLFILLLGGAIAIWQARNSVEKEVTSSINFAMQMIDLRYAQLPSAHHASDWYNHYSALQQTRHLRISVEDDQGSPILILKEASRNDVTPMPPDWFIAAVMTEYTSKKYTVALADGRTNRIVISADPLDEISEAWRESKTFFLSILLMASAIFVAINLTFHSIVKAVNSIVAGLHLVEAGKYDVILPCFDITEFDVISKEINKMSSALKTAEKNNQALARYTMQIQESERQKMSRELHDEMGQSLTAIKAMAVTSKQPNSDVPTIANSIIDICNHLAKVVRSMMSTLHPLSLSELGLHATLIDLIAEWKRRTPSLTISLNYDEELDNLDYEITINVYRIVQECLTNVVRHAQASEVDIVLDYDNHKYASPHVAISVIDNGKGANDTGAGFGLLSMRERAQSLGGSFKFISNNGVKIHATIPFTKRAELDEK